MNAAIVVLLNYLYLSSLMDFKKVKHTIKSSPISVDKHLNPQENHAYLPLLKINSINHQSKINNETFQHKQSQRPEIIHRQNKKEEDFKEVFGKQKNQENHKKSLLEMKKSIKEELRLMKYKDKLNHIEELIKQAKYLSQKYGYFYVTGINFVYTPHLEFKLCLWIHPDTKQEKRMHPIDQQTDSQTQFYKSLKFALKQLFPTICLGRGFSYHQIINNVHQLQQNLTKRLINSSSMNIISTLNTPRTATEQKNAKIIRISELIDFNNDFSIISEKDEEASVRNQRKSTFSNLSSRKPTTSPLIAGSRSSSSILKEQFTLEDSKVKPSREKLLMDLKQVLLKMDSNMRRS